MTHESYSCGHQTLAGRFTFFSKGRAALHRITALFGAGGLLLLALTGPAVARSEAGPTSSASIEISVSVASRYRIEPIGTGTLRPGNPAAGPFCMATNGQAPPLPIRLVRAVDGPNAGERELGLLPGCDGGDRTSQAEAKGIAGMAAGLFLVRPE